MRQVILTIAFTAVAFGPVSAQGRRAPQGVPPGHVPPPGQCRVWYDGVPPGRQPPPTNCRDAERIASRDRARVIYGGEARRGDRLPRAVPRTLPRQIPGATLPYPDDRQYRGLAFDNGYEDGYDKGREDGRDNDRYDPARHGRYRSADRGYDRRDGSKAAYQRAYRDGFRAGYDDGYRDSGRGNRDRRWPDIRIPWPF